MSALVTTLSALLIQARRVRGRRKTKLPLLLFFTDPARTPDPAAIIARLPRGCAVVYRAFGDAKALQQGARLAAAARRRGLLFLVGADPNLARRLRADGVHLPARNASRAKALKAKNWIVTAAAHDSKEARRAAKAGAHAIVLSPIFPSNSPSAVKVLGVRAARQVISVAKTPVYALGGVTPATARRLAPAGFIGLAGIEVFLNLRT